MGDEVSINDTKSTGTSRHDKVVEWKNELSENGDLTQAVVHIEVSFGNPGEKNSFDDG